MFIYVCRQIEYYRKIYFNHKNGHTKQTNSQQEHNMYNKNIYFNYVMMNGTIFT